MNIVKNLLRGVSIFVGVSILLIALVSFIDYLEKFHENISFIITAICGYIAITCIFWKDNK